MRAIPVRLLLPCFAIIVLAAASVADPLPKNLERVDPKAPCFRWPAVDYDEDGVYDRIDYCPNTPKGCAVDQWGCSLDADGDGVCDTFDQCPNTAAGEKVDKSGCSASQAAPASGAARTTPPRARSNRPLSKEGEALAAGETVRLENIEFETNSAKLTRDSEKTLDGIADALGDYPDLKFEIGGHSDMTGPADANQRLSQQRAESVRTYMLDHSSLKPENLVAKGYGEAHPLTPERTEAQKKEDRRVELKLLNPKKLPKNIKVEK